MTSTRAGMTAMAVQDRETTVTVEVRDLRMRYADLDVLDGVGFTAHSGEVLALLGPNGAGKTTTIEILEGFRRRSAGVVSVLGVDPEQGGDAWRADVGVVLQSWRDHGKWRVRELLDHLGRYYLPYASPDRPRPYRPDDVIDIVGLGDRANARIATLSGGERRRLDLGIGIVGRPRILFLDEPTAGLDPVGRRGFHELVHRLADLDETTVLLATHDLDEAEKLADRILILDRGRILADGSPDELSRAVSGRAEVRWSRAGERFVHATSDATPFVRELFDQHGADVADLEVRRASLEDAYMAVVQLRESGRRLAPVVELAEFRR